MREAGTRGVGSGATRGGRKKGRRVRTLVKGAGRVGRCRVRIDSKGVGGSGLERYAESACGMETRSEAAGMISSNSQDDRREEEWIKTRAVLASGKPRRNVEPAQDGNLTCDTP
jgi:hypothetical protein